MRSNYFLLLDSSGWIELLQVGNRSSQIQKELNAAKEVFVPTLVIFEVYRKITSKLSESEGLQAVALLRQHTVVPITTEISTTGADLSLQHGLGMADSIILSCAHSCHATLVTLDNDFAGLPAVKVIRA